MANIFNLVLQAFLLLQGIALGDVVTNTSSPPPAAAAAAALTGSSKVATYQAPTFQVSTSNKVVWKEQGVQNVSINISSSSRSLYKSVLGWCMQLLQSSDGDADIDCMSASAGYEESATMPKDDIGQITVPANVSKVPPIQMKLNWTTIRADSEYTLAARLVGLENANVPSQQGIAMFIYGIPSGSCPPGTVNKNQRTQPPLTFHEPNATLQDMYLEVCSSDGSCANNPSNLQRKFLHPTFSPVESNYSALVPHSSSTATLVLHSIRTGDTVLFDASQCKRLKTANQTITEDKQEIRYDISPQLGTVCNLTISVRRQEEERSNEAPAHQPPPNSSLTPANLTASSGRSASNTTAAKPRTHNFTITLVQLLDPMDLQLTTLAVTNSSHTLVLCGNYTPSVFKFPRESVTQAEPFSPRCDEGTCFSVYADQLPQRGHMLLSPGQRLAAYITALPAPKTFSRGNASFEKLSITIKSEEEDIHNQVSYRLLVIHNASDPDTNTEKLLCSTMTSSTSDVMPTVPIQTDNSTTKDQTLLKKWIFANRNPSYPNHPAQDKSCLICPSGTHSAKPDADACQYCPPGYSANLSQWPAPLLSTCKPCKPGTFSSWGAGLCRRCWAGTYASGNASTACQLCPPGKSTKTDGAVSCDVNVTNHKNIDYDSVLLQFEVELAGNFNLDQLPVTTGINSTGPAILSYLMRRDVAAWLNVSTNDVDTSLPVAPARHLIKMDVSAKLEDESEAARSSKQLTSDEVVAGLSEGEAVKYSGASQVNVRILSKIEMHRKKRKQMQQLHAILWPVLLGAAALAGTTWWLCRKYLRRRNRKMPLQIHDTTGFLRWLNRDSVGHSSVSGGELAMLDMELPDLAVNSSTSPTPGVQRHRKQFMTNYSSDDSP